MMSILLTNAHLVIDDQKEILKGALEYDKGKIEKVYFDSDKRLSLKKGYDLKGLVVMPAFHLPSVHDTLDDHLYIGDLDYLNLREFTFKLKDNDYLFELFKGERYVLVDPLKCDDQTLCFILKMIAKNRVIMACKDKATALKEAKRIYDLGFTLRDIAAYFSLNLLRLTNNYQKRGALIKGKRPEFMILKDDLNLVYEEGRDVFY